MKGKTWLRYLFYIFLTILVVYFKGYFENLYANEIKKNFKVEWYMLISTALITAAIGVALGLEHLWIQAKEKGRWRMNGGRFIILGIPALYLSSMYIISNIPNMNGLAWPVYKIFGNASFISIFQIIFGYVLITSFYKSEKIAEKNSIEDSVSDEIEDLELMDEEPEHSLGAGLYFY